MAHSWQDPWNWWPSAWQVPLILGGGNSRPDFHARLGRSKLLQMEKLSSLRPSGFTLPWPSGAMPVAMRGWPCWRISGGSCCLGMVTTSNARNCWEWYCEKWWHQCQPPGIMLLVNGGRNVKQKQNQQGLANRTAENCPKYLMGLDDFGSYTRLKVFPQLRFELAFFFHGGCSSF